MTARFGDVEETLRLTRQSLADSMVPETCLNIERQLTLARMALHRTEEAVADKTLHELCANIDARLERTEDTLHRSEGIVAESLRELSARMTARFAETEETIQRIERIVSLRTVEQTPAQQPSVRMDDRPVQTEETARQTNRPILLPWMARLAVPSLALDGQTRCACIGVGGRFRNWSPAQDEPRRGSGGRGSGEGCAAHDHRADFDSCGAGNEPGDRRALFNRADGERPSVHPRERGFRAAAAVA